MAEMSMGRQPEERGVQISITVAVHPSLDTSAPHETYTGTEELPLGWWAQETCTLKKCDCGAWRSAAVNWID